MSHYALTPLAKADVFEIWRYIAEDNEGAADRVEQAIYDAMFVPGQWADARAHPARPDVPFAAFLDPLALPQLHGCLSSADSPA
jgi:hypothetical protein